MEFNSKKGQIAIEYILFIAIFLLFFQAVIKPAFDFSENVVTDIQSLTQSKENIDLLGQNIDSISSSLGSGKRTVFLYLPNTATITDCNNFLKQLNYKISISNMAPKPSISNCDSNTNTCYFAKQLYIGTNNIYCDAIGPGFSGELTIFKSTNGDLNVSIK